MATEVAQAYVQIMPSAKGIKGGIEKSLGGQAGPAGRSAGHKFSLGMKAAVAAAAIGAFVGKSVTEGAALQQSLGGIETLFKDSADVIKQRADEAYRTAGMSANQYMELTTGFAASLLQSLGGDTAKAADISDMAMTDMSDNANKMGTDMERITDAYQGFAKGNYTMLDNLKLGYGGTQKEMKRLLADAQAVTGVKYDINNLADVYEAIHVIQGELDITGTTAKEASETISGSFAAMKGAFANVMGKMALGQDIGPALNGLMESTVTFAANLVPAVLNVLKALPGAMATVIKTAVPRMAQALQGIGPKFTAAIRITIPQAIATAGEMITGWIGKANEFLPGIISTGTLVISNLLAGIQSSMGRLVISGYQVISQFLLSLIQNLPQILTAGGTILQNLIQGIGNNLPGMLAAAGQAISTLLTGIVTNLPSIIAAGFDLIVHMVQGIGNAAPNIITAIGNLMQQLWNAVTSIDWVSLGKDIIQGLINGIGAMAGALWEAATNIAHNCLDAIKKALGIGSPSKVMRDEVGKWIPAGVAIGIERNTAPVTDAMRHLADTAVGGVTGRLTAGLRPAYAVPMAGGYGPVYNQTIYTHDSLSPSELTREAENMFQRQKWGLP